jgi:SAM-dependent methyltransferase
MAVFKNYARYYDLLYRDKDYEAEADYVHSLIQRNAPGSSSIMELGCGTGKHAMLLAEKGYSVHGVDLSEGMLEEAESRRRSLPIEVREKLSFTHGDVRTVRVGATFDVVISLFHVVSYQTTNEDLQAQFETAKAHLKPGGMFIFDCWYGPAVLTERPEARLKQLEDECIQVTRAANPEIYPNENCVDVNYELVVREKASQETEAVSYTHLTLPTN